MLLPELFLANSVALVNFQNVPAPGYFPCPDSDSDGVADSICHSVNDVLPDPEVTVSAKLPKEVKTRILFGLLGDSLSYYFPSENHYLYFLDKRFAVYDDSGTGSRFAPLTPPVLDSENYASAIEPQLTLNGKAGYIAILIDPGSDGNVDNAENRDGDRHFIYRPDQEFLKNALDKLFPDASTQDKIVGIHFDEWMILMAQRVCKERERFEPGTDMPVLNLLGNDHWYGNGASLSWQTWSEACP
ncbi:conserved hypothetical protein [uncultured Thiomicrorhabdus sp.]